jgi:hypothetical protein
MADDLTSTASKVLARNYQGISPLLLAEFFPMVWQQGEDGGTNKWIRATEEQSIICPLLGDDFAWEFSHQWTSPFEGAGAESKAPMLAAMMQSGSFEPIVSAIEGHLPKDSNGNPVNLFGGKSSAELGAAMQGRSGITKLNSTQVFSGSESAKISLRLLLRARHDANAEVMQPLITLLAWATPQFLSNTSLLANTIKELSAESSAESIMQALLPSKTPQVIGMTYKGRTFSPLVIESISDPLGSPITSKGDYAEAVLSISLSTLMALDADDIRFNFGLPKKNTQT